MTNTLFISDLDGTLLNKNAQISEFTRNTLNSLISDGLKFTVATARSIISAGKKLDGVNWNLPGVFMNGVLLCDILSHNTIDFKTIPQDDVLKMIEIFKKYNRPPSVFTFNGKQIDDFYKTAISVRSGGLKHQADVDFYESRKNKYNEYLITNDYKTENAIYVNGMDDYETMKSISDEIKKINSVSSELYLDIYSQMWLLECHSNTGTKAKRLQELKHKLNADKVVAFGDNFNDIEMLKAADTAIVVSNAPDKVKEYADIIIDSNENNGVAKYLLKY